jgi:hypothetical protein
MNILWARLGPGVDMVNGHTISRSGPMPRIIIGRVCHHTVTTLFDLKGRDVDCDFRLMRRSTFEKVRIEKTSAVIRLEMIEKDQDAGFAIVEALCPRHS